MVCICCEERVLCISSMVFNNRISVSEEDSGVFVLFKGCLCWFIDGEIIKCFGC